MLNHVPTCWDVVIKLAEFIAILVCLFGLFSRLD